MEFRKKIDNLLKGPIIKIYFFIIAAVYLLIGISGFSMSFYNFLAYGQEIKEINTLSGYVLSYNNNGGTGCGNDVVQHRNTEWEDLCVPTKEGYAFKG